MVKQKSSTLRINNSMRYLANAFLTFVLGRNLLPTPTPKTISFLASKSALLSMAGLYRKPYNIEANIFKKYRTYCWEVKPNYTSTVHRWDQYFLCTQVSVYEGRISQCQSLLRDKSSRIKRHSRVLLYLPDDIELKSYSNPTCAAKTKRT